jgi:RNA polymerase sigma-70 factor (ECF subfamily)
LQRVKQDDQEAWSRLVGLYSPLVYYWCRQKAQLSPEDAADVLQEVFPAVAQHIEAFHRTQSSGSFRGWLRVITSNKIRNHFRRQNAAPLVCQERAEQILGRLPTVEDPSSASAGIRRDEWAILLRQSLELLRGRFEPHCWEAFWRAKVERQPRADVALSLNMSVAAVNQAIYRIGRRLREELQENPAYMADVP